MARPVRGQLRCLSDRASVAAFRRAPAKSCSDGCDGGALRAPK
jgi:hypothetical protein